MGRSDRRDPKLSEVKAVLQRLQDISAEDESPDPQSARQGEQSHAGSIQPIVKAGIIFGAAAVVISGGVAFFVGFAGPSPTAPGAKSVSGAVAPTPIRDVGPPALAGARSSDPSVALATKEALEAARGLIAKGQVRAAREQLLALAQQASPDAAWDLARSYDPNVLTALPAADAAPDVKEAARWYRAWYAAAVREGLVADSVSLERIIGSMRR